MKQVLNVAIALNACIWPWVFAGYAIVYHGPDRVNTFIAAGLIFGGIVFVLVAIALALANYFIPHTDTVARVAESAPAPRRLAGGGLIMVAIGSIGVIHELLSGPAVY